jgi:glycosyltransferase 2 family protein
MRSAALRHRRRLITIVIGILLVVVLWPQADTLWRSLSSLSQASLPLVAVALIMTSMTYVLSGEIYYLLLRHPVPLGSVMLVQAATALTSRVAPIGVGTMGLNALFLRRQKHKLSEALAVVAANNGLGIIGHGILLAIIATSGELPPDYQITLSWTLVYWIMLVSSVAVIILSLSDRLRHRITDALTSLRKAISSYHRQPGLLLQALATSMALSVVYTLALVACGKALGIELAFDQYFLIYSFSLLTGIVTPTPGGLVGVEAGLVGGFVAYGVSADNALAVALLYRLLTYWLPLVPGFVAFRIVQHKYF